MVMIGGHGNL